MARPWVWSPVLACALFACSSESHRGGPDGPDPEPEAPCPVDEIFVDEACLAIGLPEDLACPPGEQLVDEGCVPAGVPPSRCAEGFVAEDDGCTAVRPASPCPPGQLALLGETTCAEVAPCAATGWGDIVVEADAIYVAADATGPGDGTEGAPYPTIQAAVDAAADGTQILIAAGTYPEQVLIEGKGVRLWGLCPSAVALDPPAEGVGAIDIINGAHGTEVHRLGIQSSQVGVGVSDALGVVLAELWIHDTGDQALLADSVLGPAEVTVHHTLVEQTNLGGMVVVGAEVSVTDSVFRDAGGRGFDIFASPSDGGASAVTIDGVVVEDSTGGGIVVAGSSASIARVAVARTGPNSSGTRGWGVTMFDVPGMPPTLAELRDATVDQSHGVGVLASASSTLVERVTVRDVRAPPAGIGAVGLIVDAWDGSSAAVTADLRQTLVQGSGSLGLFVNGARDVTLDGVQIRDTEIDDNGAFGWGGSIQYAPDLGQAASVTISQSAIRRSNGGGLFVYGSELELSTTAIDDTVPGSTGRYGAAVTAVSDPTFGVPSTVTVWASVLSQSAEGGLVVAGSTASLEQSQVTTTAANGLGSYGDGVLVFSTPGSQIAAQVRVDRSRIDDSARAGVACFGSTVDISNTVVGCADFALDAETFFNQPCVLNDLGGNACGCGTPNQTCKAVSSSLEPPTAVDAPYDPEH